jgi:hypothetical protein
VPLIAVQEVVLILIRAPALALPHQTSDLPAEETDIVLPAVAWLIAVLLEPAVPWGRNVVQLIALTVFAVILPVQEAPARRVTAVPAPAPVPAVMSIIQPQIRIISAAPRVVLPEIAAAQVIPADTILPANAIALLPAPPARELLPAVAPVQPLTLRMQKEVIFVMPPVRNVHHRAPASIRDLKIYSVSVLSEAQVLIVMVVLLICAVIIRVLALTQLPAKHIVLLADIAPEPLLFPVHPRPMVFTILLLLLLVIPAVRTMCAEIAAILELKESVVRRDINLSRV